MSTDYHAKYFAHELHRNGGTGLDRLGRALFDSCVDLNPHQIEAALFALRSPLSRGVLLADEVGLGKTIEAGLVLCQHWAERKRHLLVVCPASLRKQWAIELSEKFNLPTIVLDGKTYREEVKNGISRPFDSPKIIICSMHYIANKAEEVKEIPWDLVVIDEAHKLRNAYRQSNRIGQEIRWATEDRRKVLLTATPLQNSLLELYGLSTLIDDRIFGDLPSFRTQYINYGGDIPGLRERLRHFCWRTLRNQVLEFIKYTNRQLITRPFEPTDQEHQLYEAVSNYLKRDDAYALPRGQKHLLILLVRKVLASSPYAVAGTLEKLQNRLKRIREDVRKNMTTFDLILSQEEFDDDLIDELLEDEEDSLVDDLDESLEEALPQEEGKIDLKKLDEEIEELERFKVWAHSLGIDTKTKGLLTALDVGFKQMKQRGAAQKVVIFTESRRTQTFLKGYLESNGYAGDVLTYSGTNTDETSQQVYTKWLAANQNTGRISGSKPIDIRAAILDHFKTDSSILIATEAGAEGLNLQFCSLLINFDLPWNPQRIEQRIGRCHRYGQKHDVVVMNFLNERNAADRRVHELLESKFNLFSGVFGASDDILGTIESGMDFEKRILEIYQQCRTEKEIEEAFAKLQAELDEQIKTKMEDTRKLLMEHFDEEVHDKLNVNLTGAQKKLDLMSRIFWELTHHVLKDAANFNDNQLTFQLNQSPSAFIPTGEYQLISKDKENISGDFLYRLSHPLGEHVIETGKTYDCPTAQVTFDISNHPTRISVIDKLKGKSGWLRLEHLHIESYDQQDYLLFSAMDDQGNNVDSETCEKLFNCAGQTSAGSELPANIAERLAQDADRHVKATIATNLEVNHAHFNEAREQLDKWAEDMEIAAQKELDDIKRQIRDKQRQSRQAPTMAEQHELQAQISKLEKKKRNLRRKIFDIEDEIAGKRDRLIGALEQRMQQKTTCNTLFTIRWRVV